MNRLKWASFDKLRMSVIEVGPVLESFYGHPHKIRH